MMDTKEDLAFDLVRDVVEKGIGDWGVAWLLFSDQYPDVAEQYFVSQILNDIEWDLLGDPLNEVLLTLRSRYRGVPIVSSPDFNGLIARYLDRSCLSITGAECLDEFVVGGVCQSCGERYHCDINWKAEGF